MKKSIVAIIFIPIFLSFSLMIFTGCRTTKENASVKSDSTNYVEKLVPVYVKTPADSSWLKAYFKCDSLGNVYIAQLTDLKSKGINTSFDFKDGVVNYKTDRKADSVTVYTINKTTFIKQTEKTTYTVTIIKMSLFEKIFFWIGLILSLAFIGLIIAKLKKWL